MNRPLPGDLPTLWKERAETLDQYGDPNTSRIWKIAANELERAMESSAAETLTVADAARISGYSAAYTSELDTNQVRTVGDRAGLPATRTRRPTVVTVLGPIG